MKNKLLFNNTYEKGSVTYLILQKKKDKFVGVCLEFDLEIEAKTLDEAKKCIQDYSRVWLKNARKNKLSEEVLNRPAPKEYWKIYEEALNQDLKKLEAEKKNFANIDIKPQQVVKLQSPYPNFAFL